MLHSLLILCCMLLQSNGAGGTPTMAEKMSSLKMVNANGDFADFSQPSVEQCTLCCYWHEYMASV